jgi:hypothetical protein
MLLSPVRGRGWERGWRTLSKSDIDRRPNAFSVLHDLACRKAQDVPTQILNRRSAAYIGSDLVVVKVSVDLDDELPRDAREVGEVGTDRMLATELQVGHSMSAQDIPADLSMSAQDIPADLFGAARVSAEQSCAFDFPDHAPSPSLSP